MEARRWLSVFMTAECSNFEVWASGMVKGNEECVLRSSLRLSGNEWLFEFRIRLTCSKRQLVMKSSTSLIEYLLSAVSLSMPIMRSILFWITCISALISTVQVSSNMAL